jgi:hypothetical protein
MMESNNFSVSGPTARDCYYISQRYDAERGFKPDESESWVMSHWVSPSGELNVTSHYGTTSWLSGLWRSPSGIAFVADSDGELLLNADLRNNTNWAKSDLRVTLDGVWGLADDCVYAWGATLKGRAPLFKYDGKSWKEVPAPDFEIRALHGLSADFLWAVGTHGGIAFWNGQRWKRFPAPTDEVLNCVFVAGRDEYYATGGHGILLEGSAAGWGKISQCPVPSQPLLAVAKWHGELWVAGGQLGLFKRKGISNELELIKPNLKCSDFDIRKNLVIACRDMIAHTADGKSFSAVGQGALLEHRARSPLGKF